MTGAHGHRGSRTLRSYLLLPRPQDSVKWWILPLSFALGVLARGGVGGEQLLRAAAVWGVLELLVYQARYQWNDIRGFEADQRHPQGGARGRLPGPAERGRAHIRASWAVVLLRLAATAAIAVVMNLAGELAVLTGAVFGVAVFYEALRSAATGRSDAVPPPLRPAIVALWVVVGAGYAIRGVAGLALALGLLQRPALAAAATLTLWAFGIAFVTSRWALEALAFAGADGPRLVWRARAGQAREHSLALVRWLPGEIEPEGPGAAMTPAQWRPLGGRTPASAPWNIALIVAATAAGLAGRLLAGPAGAPAGLLAAAAGGALGAVILFSPRRLAAIGASGLLLAAVFALTGTPRPLLVALPWLVIAGAHAFFAAQSLATLGRPLRAALSSLLRSAGGAATEHG
jgi:hypothetical protein